VNWRARELLGIFWMLVVCTLTACSAQPETSKQHDKALPPSEGSATSATPDIVPFDTSANSITAPLKSIYIGAGVGKDAVDSWSAWSPEDGSDLSLAYASQPLGQPLPIREAQEAFDSFVKEGAVLSRGRTPAWDGVVSWILSEGPRGFCLSFSWLSVTPSPDLSISLGGAYCRHDLAEPAAQTLINLLDLDVYMLVGKGRYANYRERLTDRVASGNAVVVPADLQAEMNACFVDALMKVYTKEEINLLDDISRGSIRVKRKEMIIFDAVVTRRIAVQGGAMALYQKTCPDTIAKIKARQT
jgi:hypothetical protein